MKYTYTHPNSMKGAESADFCARYASRIIILSESDPTVDADLQAIAQEYFAVNEYSKPSKAAFLRKARTKVFEFSQQEKEETIKQFCGHWTISTIHPTPNEEREEYLEAEDNQQQENIREQDDEQQTPPVMATTLPKKLKLDGIRAYDGIAGTLDDLDASVKDILLSENIPCYYGGYVTGSQDEEYTYVAHNTLQAKSNYFLGKRICHAMANKFKGAAHAWWLDFQSRTEDAGMPNCWKLHTSAPNPVTNAIPDGFVEVSLHALLLAESKPELVEQMAMVELSKLKWDPLAEKGDTQAIYVGKINKLLTQAGIDKAFQRTTHIRKTFPQWLSSQVQIRSDEQAFWSQVSDVVMTRQIDALEIKATSKTTVGDRPVKEKPKYSPDKTCSGCSKTGYLFTECWTCNAHLKPSKGSDGPKAPTAPNSSSKSCSFCDAPGHDETNCRTKKRYQQQCQADRAARKNESGQQSRQGQQQFQQQSPNTGYRPYQGQGQNGTNTQRNMSSVKCYNCNDFGHYASSCNRPRQQTGVHNFQTAPAMGERSYNQQPQQQQFQQQHQQPQQQQQGNGSHMPSYNVFTTTITDIPSVTGPHGCEQFDDYSQAYMPGGSVAAPLPMFQVLQQQPEAKEVLVLPKLNPLREPPPETNMWSIERTIHDQPLLTIQDSGCGPAIIPLSTLNNTGSWVVEESTQSFIVGDNQSWKPVGEVPDFKAVIGGIAYCFHVFVVERAHFQLLLGTRFYHGTGALLFPLGKTVHLTIPSRVTIHCNLRAVTKADIRHLQFEDSNNPDRKTYDLPTTRLRSGLPMTSINTVYSYDNAAESCNAMAIGRDFLDEVDGPLRRKDLPPLPTSIEMHITPKFVEEQFEWSLDVPVRVKERLCREVIRHSAAYSWHEYDLGRITDVPHDVHPFDPTPAVDVTRKHLYQPRNQEILHLKMDPLIELGIYELAPPNTTNKMQLVITRKKASNEADADDPKLARVAHDCRKANASLHLDPYPLPTIEGLHDFLLGKGRVAAFDADRGFNQIVQTLEAARHYAWEMFGKLWVSNRLLFGPINGPAIFQRNSDVLLETLKGVDGVCFGYFDDIFAATKGCTERATNAVTTNNNEEWNELIDTSVKLMQRAIQKGWKFKPRKTRWGFDEILATGVIWSRNGSRINPKLIDALDALQPPRQASDLLSILGTANCFRDRVPGYALHVPILTSLSRLKGSVVLSPEALTEFDELKQFLRHPCVLMQWNPDRETKVYSDASRGKQDGTVAGGLGGVVTQIHDGSEYVVSYLSCGLTEAQRRYPIPRLEVCSFLFVLSKFGHRLHGKQFTWINDSRASSYIHEARYDTNPAIAAYSMAVSEFRYEVKWLAGTKMIADPFSRMVVVPAGVEDAMTNSEMVFGREAVCPLQPPEPGKKATTMTLSTHRVELESTDGVWDGYDEALPALMMCEIPERYLHLFQTNTDVNTGPPDMTYSPEIISPPIHALPSEDDPLPIPKLTYRDKLNLRALPLLRAWLRDKSAPTEKLLNKAVKRLAQNVSIATDGKLIKSSRTCPPVEVIETIEKVDEILHLLHEGFGHQGAEKVYLLFKKKYYFPAAARVIYRHVLGCVPCQKLSKNNKLVSPGYVQEPADILTHWSIDFAGPFPPTEDGHTFAIFGTDFLTRWVEVGTCKAATAAEAAKFIYEVIITRYGCPVSLRSDQGPHFYAELIWNLTEIMKIQHNYSTPYYPQSNGRVERIIGTIKRLLTRKVLEFMSTSEDIRPDWRPLLHSVLWSYRTTPHSVTKVSPAKLLYGVELRLPFDKTPNAIEIPSTDDEHRDLVARRLRYMTDNIPGLRRDKDKTRNMPHTPPPVYKMGQYVWLRNTKYDVHGIVPIFSERWIGPYTVAGVLPKNTYRLRTIPEISRKRTMLLAQPVNGLRLKPFTESLEDAMKRAKARPGRIAETEPLGDEPQNDF